MNVLNVAFVLLISLAGVVFGFQGLKKKSPVMMYISVIFIFVPILLFMDWLTFLPFIAPAALASGYLVKNKDKTNIRTL
ncbi:hypothetical protein ABEW61_02560 [Paenibacillus amylolyticus]|uniref:hypothetical protein n=1 Tax=Paenibacillus amylolyticus TaxID=1451 RepID=UPI003D28495D